MERILLTTNYPDLNRLDLYNINEETLTHLFTVIYRNTIISKIETIVTICGGYIDDFNFFSDLAVTLRILGIRQPDTLGQFYQRLKLDTKELQLDDETITTLNNCSSSLDRYSLFILFQILFIDAKGDLKQDVPAINS
ncbi:unnamed protein product [Rotaria sordida]|uniref:Uncharacterized protein n=1 Tax=Rotaria sordida TaxID=392033 RepID=A0A819P809_9BILA|nr:unnamed protein product [Rotaria sordida]CAF4009567.1 unnamed protein product [Rotaria sordida]